MRDHLAMVRQFMSRHQLPLGVFPGSLPATDLTRVSLIVEEAGELALALSKRDEVGVADALADLLYVVLGAALTYGVPLQSVFEEVHASNMTKAPRGSRDERIKDKGASYRPPDVAGVLRSVGLDRSGDPEFRQLFHLDDEE